MNRHYFTCTARKAAFLESCQCVKVAVANPQESLRQCCEQTISSALSAAKEAELEFSRREEHLKEMEKEGKSRRRRAAIREKPENRKNERENTTQTSTSVEPSSDSPPGKTVSDSPGLGEAASQSKIPNLDPTGPLGYTHTTIQAATTQLSLEFTDHRNTNPSADMEALADGADNQHNHTAAPEDLVLGVKDEGTTSLKHSVTENDSKEKNYEKASAAHGKMKDNEVVDVRERELEREQTHSVTHSRHKGENGGFRSVSKSQSESPPLQQQHPQPAMYLPGNQECDSCKAGEHCDCAKASGAEARAAAATVSHGLPRTPRTDEAVWAAAALGFLLVLLTLSVLHTRLYRHWRTTPSLYWHDPRQDYDSVAGKRSGPHESVAKEMTYPPDSLNHVS